MPWLQLVVPLLTLVAVLAILLPPRGRLLTAATAVVSAGALLLAPAAYAVTTAQTAHSGSIVAAGPGVSMPGLPPSFHPTGATQPLAGAGGTAGLGGPGGQGLPPSLRPKPATFGSGGGLLTAAVVAPEVAAMLAEDADRYTWVGAAIGSQRAAGYQLATNLAVMPLGGFNGSDPSPTLRQFQKLVAEGKIHYFISGTVGKSNGGSSDSSRISQWVEHRFTEITEGSIALYDLTK